MPRAVAVLVLVLSLAGGAASAASRQSIEAGRLGHLPLVIPEGTVDGLAFLFSDQTGWNDDLDRSAGRLAGLGMAVLEVDLRTYLANLRQSDDRDCHYLISEIEDASKRVQRQLGVEHYRSPILAGTGMGSALAYAALAQSPAATVGGAASDGLSTRLDTRTPLCPGAPATAAGSGFDYGPKAELPGWWRVAVDPAHRPAAERFTAGVAPARLVEVAADTPLDERMVQLLADPVTDAETDGPDLKGLPLVEVPVAQPGDLMAVIYSGDGGWRDLDKQIAVVLAGQGIPTVGVDSLRYFWNEKTPEQIAEDLAAIMRHYRTRWQRAHVLLIGYSFGAGILPFAANRLPPEERAMIRQISMLGLARETEFEFHVVDWLGVAPKAGARPVLPEIRHLDPRLLQCFYGQEEDDTACTAPEFDRAERIETAGGHHFDGDYHALAQKIMAGARRRSEA